MLNVIFAQQPSPLLATYFQLTACRVHSRVLPIILFSGQTHVTNSGQWLGSRSDICHFQVAVSKCNLQTLEVAFALLGCPKGNIQDAFHQPVAALPTCSLSKKCTCSVSGPGDFNIVTSAPPSLLSSLHLKFILWEGDEKIGVFSLAGASHCILLMAAFQVFVLSPHCLCKWYFKGSDTLSIFHHLADARNNMLFLWSRLCSWMRTESGLCGRAAEGVGNTKDKWNLLRQHFHWTEKKNKFNLLQRVQSPSEHTLFHQILYHARFCPSHLGCHHTSVDSSLFYSFHSRGLPQTLHLTC